MKINHLNITNIEALATWRADAYITLDDLCSVCFHMIIYTKKTISYVYGKNRYMSAFVPCSTEKETEASEDCSYIDIRKKSRVAVLETIPIFYNSNEVRCTFVHTKLFR